MQTHPFLYAPYLYMYLIEWSWEFLTEVVGLPADRLYPSVYLEDDEAFDIWNKKIGIAKDRIFKFGKEDNFWEHSDDLSFQKSPKTFLLIH